MKSQEQTLIDVWNKLEGIWLHHQDGSDCFPVPERFGDGRNEKYKEWKKKYGNDSLIFDIVFNEIRHQIKDSIPEDRHKELN